jgi:hypothetical protein
MTLTRCRVNVLNAMVMTEIAVRQPRIAIMQIRRARSALSDVFRLYEFQLNTHNPRKPGQLRDFQLPPPAAGCGRGGNEAGNDGGGVAGASGGTSASIWVGWCCCALNILNVRWKAGTAIRKCRAHVAYMTRGGCAAAGCQCFTRLVGAS